MPPPSPANRPRRAVLFGAGLDSAILLSEQLRQGFEVYPIYLRCGLIWESAELAAARRYLDAVASPALHTLVILDEPMRDLYGDHWSLTGQGVPDAATPDEAVFLPGRNLWLLTKPLLWCAQHAVPELALGTLLSNPFPDATPVFFATLEQMIEQSLGQRIAIVRPWASLHKDEVMRLGKDFPLELTFSCLQPRAQRHCGRCNKCAERRAAFAAVGMRDPTDYAVA